MLSILASVDTAVRAGRTGRIVVPRASATKLRVSRMFTQTPTSPPPGPIDRWRAHPAAFTRKEREGKAEETWRPGHPACPPRFLFNPSPGDPCEGRRDDAPFS